MSNAVPSRLPWLLVVAAGVFVLAAGARGLGFGDGLLVGATPAAGLALGAAVVLRLPGAAAAAAGFAAAGLAAELGPGLALLDAGAHGAAAAVGAAAMRGLARRRGVRSRTSDWFIFLAGVVAFMASLGAVFATAALLGDLGSGADARDLPVLAANFSALGLLTVGAVLANLREWPAVTADPEPGAGIAALAAFLIGLLAVLLSLPMPYLTPSGLTLLLSLPFCLWVAMQRRSLDGAALSCVAAHIVLALLLAQIGSILATGYVAAVFCLNLLVAVCQLVHAVNRDRLAALEEVEAKKRELERRVAERTAKLRAMTEQALAADAAKTRFIATVSHEVRTPLNGVIGMASVVLAGDIDARTRRNVEIIRTSGFHLLDVINRILDFARGDQPIGEADLVDFDLAALASEVLEEARFLPYAQGIELGAEIAPGLALRRRGYRQGLRQVLTNLVGNAAKFTERGRVTLRLAPAGGDLIRLEVEDTGRGIPPERQERIFEPFERGDGPRGYAGTGLGLAISADVARRMGGRIGVESTPGRGALFWVEVPLDPPAGDAPAGATLALHA